MSITRVTHDRSHSALGLGLALLSAATFGTSGTFADSLMKTGWTPGAVVTARVLGAAVLLTVPGIVSMRGKWGKLRQELPTIIAFGLIAVVGCQLFFFNAVQHVHVGIALLLEYLGILVVVVWMWLRNGQRPRRLTIIGGAAALFGLVLVLHPGTGSVDPIGLFWGLLAACGLAVYFVLSSKADDVLPPIAMSWAAMVVGTVTLIVLDLVRALPFHTASHDVVLLDRRTSWIVPVLGLSLVAAAIAYGLGIAAARLLGARLASFVGLTEVLFGILIAWVLLGQALGVGQVIGGAVVLLGIALVRVDDMRPQPSASAEPELVAQAS